MIPQILNLGPFPINSFGLMVALCFFAAIYRLQKSFRIAGIDPQLAEQYVFTAGVVGLIGARLWSMFTDWSYTREHFIEALTSSAGFTFYGGFIFSMIALLILVRRDGIGVVRFVDATGPALTLGYAIGRLGCQLSGDGDYGIITDSIWGMSYATGVIPTPPNVMVYPTPFFESLLAVVILYFLSMVEVSPRWVAPLKKCGLYLLLTGLARFLIEFIRGNPKWVGGLSEAQIIAIVIIMVGAGFLFYARSTLHDRSPA